MTDTARSDAVWSTIEQNKRTDRFIRRVAIVAWSATAVVLLAYATIIGFQVVNLVRSNWMGAMNGLVIGSTLTPFVGVVGLFALLIAVLATIGSFVRMRTTSLAEIQLRLAALEDLLRERGKET